MDARSRLLARIGDINNFDLPRPLVTLEEFFTDNNDTMSIGDNPQKKFSPQEFFAELLLLRERKEVADVLVEVKNLEDPEGWPFTNTIWIITSMDRSELPRQLSREFWDNFLPDDWLSYPRLDGGSTEPMTIPNGMRAFGYYY